MFDKSKFVHLLCHPSDVVTKGVKYKIVCILFRFFQDTLFVPKFSDVCEYFYGVIKMISCVQEKLAKVLSDFIRLACMIFCTTSKEKVTI